MATIDRFRDVLIAAPEAAILADTSLGGKLRLVQRGRISIDYAPFEYVERKARIVIVGITPGAQQAKNALCEARRVLLAGHNETTAIKAAKVFASFSGPMRSNLIAMLDHVGINAAINVRSTAELWAHRSDLVHFTSALRYPVYLDGKNYSGTPSMTSVDVLTSMLEQYLSEEAKTLIDAIWVPLGPAATEGMSWIIRRGFLARDRVIMGLPHPSGANAERVAYFLQKKQRAQLSSKTSPAKIDAARDSIIAQVSAIRLSRLIQNGGA
jgi:hypothetical protein